MKFCNKCGTELELDNHCCQNCGNIVKPIVTFKLFGYNLSFKGRANRKELVKTLFLIHGIRLMVVYCIIFFLLRDLGFAFFYYQQIKFIRINQLLLGTYFNNPFAYRWNIIDMIFMLLLVPISVRRFHDIRYQIGQIVSIFALLVFFNSLLFISLWYIPFWYIIPYEWWTDFGINFIPFIYLSYIIIFFQKGTKISNKNGHEPKNIKE